MRNKFFTGLTVFFAVSYALFTFFGIVYANDVTGWQVAAQNPLAASGALDLVLGVLTCVSIGVCLFFAFFAEYLPKLLFLTALFPALYGLLRFFQILSAGTVAQYQKNLLPYFAPVVLLLLFALSAPLPSFLRLASGAAAAILVLETALFLFSLFSGENLSLYYYRAELPGNLSDFSYVRVSLSVLLANFSYYAFSLFLALNARKSA